MQVGPVLVRRMLGCGQGAVDDLDDLVARQLLGIVLDQDRAGQRIGLVRVHPQDAHQLALDGLAEVALAMNHRVLDPQSSRDLGLDLPVRDGRPITKEADLALLVADRSHPGDCHAMRSVRIGCRGRGMAIRLDRRVTVRAGLASGRGVDVGAVLPFLPARGQAGGDPLNDVRKGERSVAESQVGVRRLPGVLMRIDRDVGDLRSLKDPLKELPACLVARFGKEIAALKANLALTGKADRDVHGCPWVYLVRFVMVSSSTRHSPSPHEIGRPSGGPDRC